MYVYIFKQSDAKLLIVQIWNYGLREHSHTQRDTHTHRCEDGVQFRLILCKYFIRLKFFAISIDIAVYCCFLSDWIEKFSDALAHA